MPLWRPASAPALPGRSSRCLSPRRAAPQAASADGQSLYDFRPVFRNRSAMAYALAYCIHTLEMNALRGWAVAFLAFVATKHRRLPGHRLSRRFVVTALGLIGTVASVVGNEAAIRLGRRRLVSLAMLGSMLVALCLGFVGTDVLLRGRRPAAALWSGGVAEFVVPDGGGGRDRRTISARRHLGGAFDAGLRGRFCRAVGGGMDAGSCRWTIAGRHGARRSR